MRFMIIRKADAETENGPDIPSEELVRDMLAYHEEMGRHLKILGGDGLHPSSRGKRVKFKAGKPMVIDGPFAETKELIAGFTLVEANSLDEVIEWALKWPCRDADGNVELEIRQVYETDEMGEAFTPELQAMKERVVPSQRG